MPSTDENSEKSNATSSPELNPLLNPILSKHMGRWAEVYFNSPRDRRDIAVLELIRELEHEDRAAMPSFRRSGQAAAAPALKREAPSPLICWACNYVNRPLHKFCGRCGALLDGMSTETRTTETRIEEEEPRERNQPPPEPIGSTLLRESSPTFGMEMDSSERSYRPYIGVVLALVVVGLAYVGWRGNQTSGGTTPLPQVPTASTNTPQNTTQESSAPSANPGTPAPPAARPNTPAPEPSRPVATSPAAAEASSPAKSTSGTDEATTTREPAALSAQPMTQSAPGPGNGSQELAIARDFLDGANGRVHNQAQAAQWLWKAVGKQNVEATVILSNLYLHGDGVPKNCDQARLLLDAAAIKGRKDAAAQLRNLRAFGCE